MAAIQHGDVGQRPGEAKKKEISTYLAPWTVYGMNWSVRPDKRFRLAIGSFIEDYKNKVSSPLSLSLSLSLSLIFNIVCICARARVDICMRIYNIMCMCLDTEREQE